MKRIAFLAAALSLMAAHAWAADPAEGDWLNQDGDAKIRMAPCGGEPAKLCGNIVWLKAPRDEAGAPKHDIHNTDAAQRSRPLMGLRMIWGFKSAGPGRWEGGKIYNPKDGKTYASKVRVAEDGTLKVAGCVMVICKTQTWRRTS